MARRRHRRRLTAGRCSSTSLRQQRNSPSHSPHVPVEPVQASIQSNPIRSKQARHVVHSSASRGRRRTHTCAATLFGGVPTWGRGGRGASEARSTRPRRTAGCVAATARTAWLSLGPGTPRHAWPTEDDDDDRRARPWWLLAGGDACTAAACHSAFFFCPRMEQSPGFSKFKPRAWS